MKQERIDEITKLAQEHFEANERFKAEQLRGLPQEFEERKKAAVNYALSEAEAGESYMRLRDAINKKNQEE